MDRELVREKMAGYRAVNRLDIERYRNMSMEERWRELMMIYGFWNSLGRMKPESDPDPQRDPWIRLRKLWIAQNR